MARQAGVEAEVLGRLEVARRMRVVGTSLLAVLLLVQTPSPVAAGAGEVAEVAASTEAIVAGEEDVEAEVEREVDQASRTARLLPAPMRFRLLLLRRAVASRHRTPATRSRSQTARPRLRSKARRISRTRHVGATRGLRGRRIFAICIRMPRRLKMAARRCEGESETYWGTEFF